jgi:hypothetical protein
VVADPDGGFDGCSEGASDRQAARMRAIKTIAVWRIIGE